MRHILVGFHHDTHRGQNVPALIGHGHHRTAVPIAFDFLPITRRHNNGAGNTIALCHMTEILNHCAANNLQKLLTVVGNGLPVFNG